MAEVQTEKNTVFYILYADSIELKDESVTGQKAALFWYGESGVHHCCEAFELTAKVRSKYIAFFCITLADINSPAHPITMTLSEPDGEHIGVAFLDVSQFSAEENFQEMSVELLTAAGVVAVVTLFTARQNRWAYEAVVPTTGAFIEWEKDPQAKMLYDHMMSQDAAAEEEKPAEAKPDKKEHQEAERRKEEQRQRDAEAAERKRQEEAEEKRKREEAEDRRKRDEAAAEERRRREEAAAAEEKRRKDEELDREIARDFVACHWVLYPLITFKNASQRFVEEAVWSQGAIVRHIAAAAQAARRQHSCARALALWRLRAFRSRNYNGDYRNYNGDYR
ncbi:Stress response protein nst1 [Symbiodinium microadriaticum]|uniref:Stress response protein nst1 n=1 Tax=Symbiodinium microadriaticum TaxID=2951 RepID=A0A1Q9D9Y8_SYMMI|nr:Stress response protein nst1 [Symbiodinium microadriaticum]